MMLIRSLSILSLLVLLSACGQHQTVETLPVTKPSSPSKQILQVAPFNQVEVHGLINVNLHTGYKKPSVTLHGNSLDLAQVKTRVIGGKLYIDLSKGYPDHGPVTVDIKGNYLNALTYKGTGLVKGQHLRSSSIKLCLDNDGRTILGGQLGVHTLEIAGTGYTEISGISSRSMQITTKGKPNIRLNGKAGLTSLNVDGNGNLGFYWTNSPYLKVRAHGCTSINLAGITHRLDVELWGCSKFKGRFLRAESSFVKTHDNALAEITSLNKQHSLASDASDIYYYHVPNMQTDFMAYDGAVLDMRERENP